MSSNKKPVPWGQLKKGKKQMGIDSKPVECSSPHGHTDLTFWDPISTSFSPSPYPERLPSQLVRPLLRVKEVLSSTTQQL